MAINQLLHHEFPVFPVVIDSKRLKEQLHSTLNVTRALGGQNISEGRRTEEDIGKVEIRMIQKIEEFETKLECLIFRQAGVFQQR